MILKHLVCMNKMLKLTKGQGHKVKGQGQIYIDVKDWFAYKTRIMNGWFDIDGIYTYDWCWRDFQVDTRSRSRGQGSRSNWVVWKKRFCLKNTNGWFDLIEIKIYDWYRYISWSKVKVKLNVKDNVDATDIFTSSKWPCLFTTFEIMAFYSVQTAFV